MAKSVQRPRMLWYYDAIIDWMIANPGRPLSECAKHVNRTQPTLSIIINSDSFKAALAKRKADFQQAHDIGIIQKTTKVVHASLDSILTALEKKKDGVPIETLSNLAKDSLSVLGYGTKPQGPPPGIVNNYNAPQTTVVLPVSRTELEEARMALRTAQQHHQSLPPPTDVIDVEATEVERKEVTEVEHASVPSRD